MRLILELTSRQMLICSTFKRLTKLIQKNSAEKKYYFWLVRLIVLSLLMSK